MNIIIGITGASGAIYAVKLLENLKNSDDKPVIHLVISDSAKETIETETPYDIEYIESFADFIYNNHDLGAKISSGSFLIDAMVVVPCSMKTLSAAANGYADTLISRACDVSLKEGRLLILCPRETPLNAIHLENMLKLSRLGVKIIPPMPAFYNNPGSIDDLVEYHIMKLLDVLKVKHNISRRWGN